MNAHVKPPRRVPEPGVARQLVNDAGHLVSLAFDLGACRTAEEADAKASDLEARAAGFASHSPPVSNALGSTGLTLLGDCTWRAGLFRARAKELRS